MVLIWSLVGLSTIVFLFMDIEATVKYLENNDESGLFLEVFYLNRLFKKEYSYKNLQFRLGRLFPWLYLSKEVEGPKGAELWTRHLKVGLAELRKYWMNIRFLLAGLDHWPRLKRFYFRTILIKELRWYTDVGSDDPMETGIQVGLWWGVKGWLVSYITRIFPVRQVNFWVNPRLEASSFKTVLTCDIKFKVIHVFITLWLMRGHKKRTNFICLTCYSFLK